MTFIEAKIIKIKSAKTDEELKTIIADIIVSATVDSSVQNEGINYKHD